MADMENFLWALGGLVAGIAIFLLFRRQNKPIAQDNGGMMQLQNLVLDLTKVIDGKLHENSKMVRDSLHTQFGESQKLIKEITEELTSVKETGRRVETFAEQLQSLQDILRNPKQRGILGEYYLETLLRNIMPTECYQMQYPFPDGTIVDAAVFVKDKVIPIDSKFSLENYNRLIEEKDPLEKEKIEKIFINDLKNRIVETSKYIQPENGTMDFAFMFIPHEAIYYDLLISKIGVVKSEEAENLLQRAASKYKVIIVSPTSFLAYLQTVLQGLNSLKIEEKTKEIIINVTKLRDHLKVYEEYQSKLGNSLGTVVNHYNASSKEFKKVDKDIMRITGDSLGSDLPLIDKPDNE
jgi:DNA recombination protein RmuC